MKACAIKYIFLAFFNLIWVSLTCAVPQVSLQYGSLEDAGTNTTSYFSESTFSAGNLNAFNSSNAMMAIGYFNDDTTLTTDINNLQAGSLTLSNFLTSFNVLHSDNFSNATNTLGNVQHGFLKPSSNIDEEGVGENAYIMTLFGAGIDGNWSSGASATEIGLFTDSSLSTLISGKEAPDTPPLYSASLSHFDTILLGSEIEGLDDGGGWTANVYRTQAVPEPSTYAMMLGALSFGFVYYKRRIAGKKTDQKQEA